MFIISFAIFIFTLTVFENIFLATLFLILMLIWYFVRKKIHPGGIFLIILAFLISLGSVFVKNYTYDQKIKSLPNLTWTISQDMDGPVGKYFVGTGQISDIYSYQRFIFQDNAGREYFLKSSKKYEIGDIIRLNWYVSLAYTWAKNIFDIHGQWQNFTTKPEFSGLFNYEFNYPKWLMMKGFYGTVYEQNSVVLWDECSVILSETKNPDSTYTRFFADAQNDGRSGFFADAQNDGKSGFLADAQNDGKSGFFADAQKDNLCQNNISFIQKIRKNLQKNIVHAYWENKQAWLILGMLVWDKSQIPPDEYQWFIDSWLVHIIAVSWWNIIMIVVFLWAVLFFLPFYIRNAVILLTIILYAMICGMDSSVFRATIMWWLGMLALFRWKEINIRRAMSTAFIVMLIVNPYFLTYDVWFLLSFSAIIGIIYFGGFVNKTPWFFVKTPPTIEQHPLKGEELNNLGSKTLNNFGAKVLSRLQGGGKKFIKEFMTPTIGATLGVLPIMLFFMWKTNLTWIIANFLVVPIVAVVMIYGFISTMLFKIIPREIRLRPQKILLNYIYFISDLAQKFWVYLQAEWTWIKYTLLWLFIIWLVLERRKK
jgi:ComEC/Rec2-related protein